MALILGFGEDQYRSYEEGEVPSLSNAKVINSLKDKRTFLSLLESSKDVFTLQEYDKIVAKVNAIP